MKSVFGKRFHRIPVVLMSAILAIMLITGTAFAIAPYTFLTTTTTVSVGEPVLATEYNLNGLYGGDSEWHALGDDDSMTLERSAGDDFLMDLRFTTDLDVGQTLTINTVVSGEGSGYFILTGFPEDSSIGNGVSEIFNTSVLTPGSVPPGTHTIILEFTRQ